MWICSTLIMMFFAQRHNVILLICALFVVDESDGDDHVEPDRQKTETNRKCMFLHTNGAKHM